jgi:hypothetical protein
MRNCDEEFYAICIVRGRAPKDGLGIMLPGEGSTWLWTASTHG